MEILAFPNLYVLIVLALVSLWCFATSVKHRNLPPGPFNFPVIGCLHMLGSLPHRSLHKLSKKYGDVMYLKLGSVSTVIVSSEKAAKDMFQFYSLELASKVPLISGKYLGNNYSGIIFSEYTPEVKFYRKLFHMHLLSPSKLKVYEGIRREEQLRLARSLRDKRGNPILLREKFHDLNMNVITYMLFGKRFCGEYKTTRDVDEFIQAIVDSVRIAGLFNLSDYIPLLRYFDVQGLKREYKKLMARVNENLNSILNERRENPPVFTDEKPLSFLDVLIAMDSTDERLSDTTKITLLFDMLLGAVDTSALSLEWTMAELLRNPAEFSQAREELDRVVGKNRLVDESDIPKLRCLEAICKESMRLHTVAPLPLPKFFRGGPIKLNGYTIPEGTVIHVNLYSIGIDEKFWKDPLEFRSDRFIDSDIDVFGQNFHLLPFGTGRRVCPGAKLGFDAVQIGAATLVQGFDWKFEHGADPTTMNMDEIFGLVCQKAEPLVAIPSPILPSRVYESEI